MTDGDSANMHDIAESILQVAQQRHQAECAQRSCQIGLHFGDRGGSFQEQYRITATPAHDKVIMEFQRVPTCDEDDPGAVVYALPRADKQQFEDGVDAIVQNIVDDLDSGAQIFDFCRGVASGSWLAGVVRVHERHRGRNVVTSRLLDGKGFEATLKRHLMNTRFLACQAPIFAVA